MTASPCLQTAATGSLIASINSSTENHMANGLDSSVPPNQTSSSPHINGSVGGVSGIGGFSDVSINGNLNGPVVSLSDQVIDYLRKLIMFPNQSTITPSLPTTTTSTIEPAHAPMIDAHLLQSQLASLELLMAATQHQSSFLFVNCDPSCAVAASATVSNGLHPSVDNGSSLNNCGIIPDPPNEADGRLGLIDSPHPMTMNVVHSQFEHHAHTASARQSSNLLHQLLIGEDLARVRTQSGLIDPSTLVESNDATGRREDLVEQQRLVKDSMISDDAISSTTSTSVCSPMDVSQLTASPPRNAPTGASSDPTQCDPYSSSDVFSQKILTLLAAGIENERRASSNNNDVSINTTTTVPQACFSDTTTTRPKPVCSQSRLQNLLTAPLVLPVQTMCVQEEQQEQQSASPPPPSLPPPPRSTTGQPGNRPRSYSDLNHHGPNYRNKLQRSHRPRSHSKLDHASYPMSARRVRNSMETAKLAHELESSLFAQLVLNPDPNSATFNAGSTPIHTLHTESTDSHRCSPSPILSHHVQRTQAPPPPQPPQPPPPPPTTTTTTSSTAEYLWTRNRTSRTRAPVTFTCVSSLRGRVFEWLRQADLFVAEHCCDVPLGTLLAVAISPGRGSSLKELTHATTIASGIPTSARLLVSKIWHQLLLIAMVENNFIPAVSVNSTESSLRNGCRDLNGSDFHRAALLSTGGGGGGGGDSIDWLVAQDLEGIPTSDANFVDDLSSLVSFGHGLNLTSEVLKSIRFCILAQNAHNQHFQTNYLEALSELEASLSASISDNDTDGLCSLTRDCLKLMNRLHCFDAGTLKQFFRLASDRIAAADALSEHHADIYDDDDHHVTATMNSPSRMMMTSNHSSHSPPSIGSNSSTTLNALTSTAFKRKAHCVSSDIATCATTTSTISSGSMEFSMKDLSPIRMRTRAYTTSSHKSARLSPGQSQSSMRQRCGTLPGHPPHEHADTRTDIEGVRQRLLQTRR